MTKAPLEPDAQRLVDMLAGLQASQEPAPTDPASMRQGLATLMKMGAGGPHEVAAVEDRRIPGPAGEIPVRIYRPDDPHGVVVYFHGGGFMLGDLDTHDPVTRQLANASGAVVVAVDYRLAPEHPFPAGPDDCLAATRWVADHTDELGLPGAKVAVAGDSAGGNLSAVTCIRARDEGGPAIAFQLLAYPGIDPSMSRPSHDENGTGYILTAEALRIFYDNYLPREEDRTNPHASLEHASDLAGLPPALVITAGYDPLRDEGTDFADRLRAAGVDVTHSNYEGAVHVFFGMPGFFAASDRAMKEAGAALRAALA
ncbi:MAG TPA: alpha/beta hydrolase [Acidimicrobiales bacterium]|nr:alpha/beta hydrolase [Acidimicrobiales bacterium]